MASVVDVVVLVLQPGSGDSVQALKAGRDGDPRRHLHQQERPPRGEGDAVRAAPRAARSAPAALRPTVVETDARSGEGVADLWAAVEDRRASLGPDGLEQRRRESLERELRTVAVPRATAVIERTLQQRAAACVARLEAREIDPLAAVGELFGAAFDDARQSA